MIPLVKPYLPARERLMPALEQILYSGYIAEGDAVKEFESRFSQLIQNPYCLATNSGSSALHIALLLTGATSGTEVISTPLTAEPTNTVIKQTGARIVWADIDPNTGTIDPDDVERKITTRTKAIVVVHYAGIVANMTRFQELSKKYSIPIVEDAAHALGAKFNQIPIGGFSPLTIFSFQAIKHLTTVDGGMIAVKNPEDFTKARLMRWFGLDKTKSRMDSDITLQGYKYHMNNVNATIGNVQLDDFETTIQAYIENGKYFDKHLRNITGLECIQYYEGSEPAYWLYTVKVENRAGFIKKLGEHGVLASELHKRNDLHSFFSESKSTLPKLDAFYQKMVHIPCGWWVSAHDREMIVETIKSGW